MGIFSFGAFFQDVNSTQQIMNYTFEERAKHVNIISAFVIVSVVFSLLYLIWMRRSILKGSLDLDLDAVTPSDFCVMGRHMVFDSYNLEDMDAQITRVFEERYGISEEEIMYINYTFNIEKIYSLTE
jgi:hypothetical protein